MKDAQVLYNKAAGYASPLSTVNNDWLPDYERPKHGVSYLDTYAGTTC